MEFDRESSMFDVTAVPQSPQYPSEEDEAIPAEDVLEGEALFMYEQYIQHPPSSQDSTHGSLHSPEMDISSSSDSDVQSHVEDQVTIPAFFHPDLDMSTAITAPSSNMPMGDSPGFQRLEPTVSLATGLPPRQPSDLVPSFYTYAIKACLLPIRRVQHELITLYFQYIHPMFPVVDECYFTELHQKYRGQEQSMEASDFIVYQAIMAAGFGHLSELQLQRTPYRSVHEGQEAQFDQVKARYWLHPTSEPVVLTQICLIISLWSPGPAGVQNNSYWINLAFKHANAAELWKSQPTIHNRPCRRRVLWWCCLVRDRILALGMRRPYRLHKAPFEEDLISEVDFGMEAMPSIAAENERIAILAFIWLCKLTEIMAAIAVFQQKTKFAREWDGASIDKTTSELEQVSAFDRDLANWKLAFEEDLFEVMDGHVDQDLPIPVSILRIVCNSLIAVLYQPYLHLSWLDHPSSLEPSIDPLQRMKEGSQGVELSVLGLITNKKNDVLPNWLVSWVTLPVAVYYVHQNVKRNPSPDPVLVPFLNRFMRRTTGAQFLFLALTKAMKEFLQKLKDQKSSSTAFGYKLAPSTHRLDRSTSASNAGMRILEAKTLAYVTKALDSTLELGC